MGTPHNIERQYQLSKWLDPSPPNLCGGGVGWSVAQPMCQFLTENIATSWLHLESWNLPDSQLSSSVAIKLTNTSPSISMHDHDQV